MNILLLRASKNHTNHISYSCENDFKISTLNIGHKCHPITFRLHRATHFNSRISWAILQSKSQKSPSPTVPIISANNVPHTPPLQLWIPSSDPSYLPQMSRLSSTSLRLQAQTERRPGHMGKIRGIWASDYSPPPQTERRPGHLGKIRGTWASEYSKSHIFHKENTNISKLHHTFYIK